MPGCAAVRPVLVAVTLAPSVMSLAAPVASRSTMPLEAVTPPRFMAPALVTATALPADRLPTLTVVLLSMSIEPAVALSESTVMPVPALATRLPVLATMVPPSALMLVPALSPMALPERFTVLPSLRLMELPAEMSRLPAAVRLLVLPLLPPSLTLRSMAPAALSRIAPEVVLFRLVVEASRMSRPELTLMAATLSARPLRVVCRLPPSVMSWPVPPDSESTPFAVVSASASIAPVVVNARPPAVLIGRPSAIRLPMAGPDTVTAMSPPATVASVALAPLSNRPWSPAAAPPVAEMVMALFCARTIPKPRVPSMNTPLSLATPGPAAPVIVMPPLPPAAVDSMVPPM
jgi:hypothetical protein